MLAAPRLAAWDHGALRSGHAVNSPRLVHRRALAMGLTGELDSFWLAVHRNWDRARQRLRRSSRLEDHADNNSRAPTVEGPPGDQLVLSEDIDWYGGDITFGIIVEIARVLAGGTHRGKYPLRRRSGYMPFGAPWAVRLALLPRCGFSLAASVSGMRAGPAN